MLSTVVDLDLVAYSDIVRTIEEIRDPDAVADLNKEIADSIRSAAINVGVTLHSANFKGTGDGGIVLFERAEQAHQFAEQMYADSSTRNASKTRFLAKRFFRMGAATGEVVVRNDDLAGMTIATAVRLQVAAQPGALLADRATVAALPPHLRRLYGDEKIIEGKRDERIPACELVFDSTAAAEVKENLRVKPRAKTTRRSSKDPHASVDRRAGLRAHHVDVRSGEKPDIEDPEFQGSGSGSAVVLRTKAELQGLPFRLDHPPRKSKATRADKLVPKIQTMLGHVTTEEAFRQVLYIAEVTGESQPPNYLTIRERRPALIEWAAAEPGEEREVRLYNALIIVTGSKAKPLRLRSEAAHSDLPATPALESSKRVQELADLATRIAGQITRDTSIVSGFLSGGTAEPTQRYHLGHYYFVLAIDALLERELRVDLLICDPLMDRVKERYKLVVKRQQKIWEDCFTKRVRVRDIYAEVNNCQVSGRYHDVAMWIGERLERGNDLFYSFEGPLSDWKRRAMMPSPTICDALRDTLKNDDGDHAVDGSTDQEIVSIATLLAKPPRWMITTSDWCGKIFRFITDGTVKHVLATDRIVLFEGERNRYIWDGLAYCARRFDMLERFPERQYIPSVPGIGTPDAMQSKEETKKIRLDPYWIDSHHDVQRQDLRPIVNRFASWNGDEYQVIKSLTTDGARRLSQNYPGKAAL